MEISKLQDEVNARWRIQRDNPCHQSDTKQHMLLHMTKAIGKLASEMNDAEHDHRELSVMEVEKYLADLVICAARFASDDFDLEEACINRISQKFPSDGADK